MEKYIRFYVEGDPGLREGFCKLFHSFQRGNKLEFLMMKGNASAIKIFKNDSRSEFKYLITDLDKKVESGKDVFLRENELEGLSDNVFFMVRQMEAWFISQPEIVNEKYKFDLVNELKRKHNFEHPKDLRSPKLKIDSLLKERSNNTLKYNEVNDGRSLLMKLDVSQLRKDFEDVERLIKKLES